MANLETEALPTHSHQLQSPGPSPTLRSLSAHFFHVAWPATRPRSAGVRPWSMPCLAFEGLQSVARMLALATQTWGVEGGLGNRLVAAVARHDLRRALMEEQCVWLTCAGASWPHCLSCHRRPACLTAVACHCCFPGCPTLPTSTVPLVHPQGKVHSATWALAAPRR